MSKAKITIVGIPEKEPKINEDGTVDLLFKTVASSTVPKGLKPLEEGYSIVHVSKKTWQKVSGKVQKDSKLLIQGEAKSSINKKGIPYIEAIALDIGIVEKKEKEDAEKKNTKPVESNQELSNTNGENKFAYPPETKELIAIEKINIPQDFQNSLPHPDKIMGMVNFITNQSKFDKAIIVDKSLNLIDGYKRYLAAKEMKLDVVPITYLEDKKPANAPNKKGNFDNKKNKPQIHREPVNWYNPEDIFSVNTNDVVLTDDIHLKAKNVSFGIEMHKLFGKPERIKPVAIRKIDDKYSLVMGARIFFAAKLLGVETIPAVLTEMSHKELMDHLGLKERKG